MLDSTHPEGPWSTRVAKPESQECIGATLGLAWCDINDSKVLVERTVQK